MNAPDFKLDVPASFAASAGSGNPGLEPRVCSCEAGSGGSGRSLRPYYDAEGVTIYHGDCLSLLGMLRADAIVTDPPYALNYTPDTGGKITGDKVRDFRRMLLKLPKALAHTGAQTLGLFTRWDIWRDVHEAFDSLWPPCAMAIWDKDNHGRGNCNHFGQAHEIIYVSAPPNHEMRIGGKRPLNIIRCPILRPAEMVHTTQKPLRVMAYLVEALCPPGGVVLDPFMGSGPTLFAARDLGLRAIGIEIDERNCEIAANRLSQPRLSLGGGGAELVGDSAATKHSGAGSQNRQAQRRGRETVSTRKTKQPVAGRCSILEAALGFIEQHGERSGWPRVRQVCQMALKGLDVRTVLRLGAAADDSEQSPVEDKDRVRLQRVGMRTQGACEHDWVPMQPGEAICRTCGDIGIALRSHTKQITD